VVRAGQSAEFFDEAVRVGVSSIFDTFVSLTIQSEAQSCGGNPDVGESVAVAGEPQPASMADEVPRVWFRVVVLELRPDSVTLRVERLISTGSPTSADPC
jgi:hypothetical protein